ILNHFAVYARDVNLLAILEGIFPERPEIAKRSLDSPLIRLLDGFFFRSAHRLFRPCRSNPPNHVSWNCNLFLAVVRVNHPLLAAGEETVDWPSVEAIEPNLVRRLV